MAKKKKKMSKRQREGWKKTLHRLGKWKKKTAKGPKGEWTAKEIDLPTDNKFWAQPLEDWTDKRLYNTVFFLRHVLGLTIAKFHREWVTLADRNINTCIMAPRGHGKTEVLIVGYTLAKLYSAVLDKHYGIDMEKKYKAKWFEAAIISKSMPQSTGVLRRIKYRLYDHPFLKRLMGDGREGKLSATEIILKDRHRIVCKPYGDTVRGIHVNLVCIDEAGTFEDKRIFTDAISAIKNKKNGSMVVIGTPTSSVDLLYDLFNNPGFKSKKYRAFRDATKMTHPLWRKEFSVTKLKNIRDTIGTLAFSREYMCEPISEEDRVFPYNLVEKGFIPKGHWITERRSNDVTYWMGCDFAMSANTGADYSAFIMVERDMNGKCRICEIHRAKGQSFEQQMNVLEDMYERFSPANVLIDARSFGASFFQRMRDEGMRVEEFKATNKSKEDIIMHLRNQFEKNNVLIPRHRETFTHTNQLVRELTNISVKLTEHAGRTGNVTYESIGGHDDMVMALAQAIYVATRFKYNPIQVRRTNHKT